MVQEGQEEDFGASFPAVDGPSLLSGLVKPISFSEVLATLLAKPAMDKLIERFFDERESPVPAFREYC
jgi:hypothetical protein